MLTFTKFKNLCSHIWKLAECLNLPEGTAIDITCVHLWKRRSDDQFSFGQQTRKRKLGHDASNVTSKKKRVLEADSRKLHHSKYQCIDSVPVETVTVLERCVNTFSVCFAGGLMHNHKSILSWRSSDPNFLVDVKAIPGGKICCLDDILEVNKCFHRFPGVREIISTETLVDITRRVSCDVMSTLNKEGLILSGDDDSVLIVTQFPYTVLFQSNN